MLAILAALTLGQVPAPAESLVLKRRNTAAADVATAVNKSLPGVTVTAEPVSNTVLVSGAAADVVRAVDRINKLDAPVPQYVIDIRICAGDPLGSRAAGTMKVLSAPKVVAAEGAAGFVRSGGQANLDGELVSVGTELKATVISMKGETIRVRFEGAHTTLEGPEKEHSIKTVKSVVTRQVKAGETTRFRIGQKADETWAEVTVRPVEAMTTAAPPYREQTGR